MRRLAVADPWEEEGRRRRGRRGRRSGEQRRGEERKKERKKNNLLAPPVRSTADLIAVASHISPLNSEQLGRQAGSASCSLMPGR